MFFCDHLCIGWRSCVQQKQMLIPLPCQTHGFIFAHNVIYKSSFGVLFKETSSNKLEDFYRLSYLCNLKKSDSSHMTSIFIYCKHPLKQVVLIDNLGGLPYLQASQGGPSLASSWSCCIGCSQKMYGYRRGGEGWCQSPGAGLKTGSWLLGCLHTPDNKKYWDIN